MERKEGEEANLETLNCFRALRKKKNKAKNHRRFSDEQIKLLETMFESETRIEPRKKLQVARELGLQPRQVAIWFQNRRARWKSKQIEQDYRRLRADYTDLGLRFESLKKEKQTLLIQLQKINELLDKDCKSKYLQESEAELSLENGNTTSKNEGKKNCPREGMDSERLKISLDENAENSRIDVDEDRELLLERVRIEDASSASIGNWYNFNSEDLFDDQSCSISHWLDFWS